MVIHEHPPEIAEARQQVAGELSGARIEPTDAIRGLVDLPDLPVAVGDHVVGRLPRLRIAVFRDLLRLGIEHADGVAAELGEPEPVLRIDPAAPCTSVGGRGRIEGEFAALGVDLADAAGSELEQVAVVLLVGVDAVDPERPVGLGIAERAEVLVLAGRDVEPHDLRAVRILHPGLAVDLRSRHREMRLLGGIALPFLGNRIDAEARGLAIEPREPGLVHQADPDIAVLVDLEIKRALRMLRLLHRDRIVRRLAGLRIHPGNELLAEMREPDHPVGINHYVMRLDLAPGQIVFRDHHPGRAAGRARELLDLEGMARAPVEIDARKVFRETLLHRGRDRRATVRAVEPLRLPVRSAGIVAAHALEHFQEIGLGVLRLEDPLHGVAVRAIEQHPLDLVRPGRAVDPFGIGDLVGSGRGGLQV